ncbi:hypothetical protein [Caldiplasma sukawensis]
MPYILAVFIVSSISLLIGSIEDHRERTVNYLLFVPVVSITMFSYFFGANLYFLIIYLALYIILFIRLPTQFYLLTITIFLIAGIIIFDLTSMPLYIFGWILISILAFLGAGEKLFGKGDIKASVALMGIFSTITIDNSNIIPFSLLFFINLGISSVISVIWSLYYTKKETGIFAISVSSDEKNALNPVRFSVKENDGKYTYSYNVPFIIFIFIAYIITVISYLSGVFI